MQICMVMVVVAAVMVIFRYCGSGIERLGSDLYGGYSVMVEMGVL